MKAVAHLHTQTGYLIPKTKDLCFTVCIEGQEVLWSRRNYIT